MRLVGAIGFYPHQLVIIITGKVEGFCIEKLLLAQFILLIELIAEYDVQSVGRSKEQQRMRVGTRLLAELRYAAILW